MIYGFFTVLCGPGFQLESKDSDLSGALVKTSGQPTVCLLRSQARRGPLGKVVIGGAGGSEKHWVRDEAAQEF